MIDVSPAHAPGAAASAPAGARGQRSHPAAPRARAARRARARVLQRRRATTCRPRSPPAPAARAARSIAICARVLHYYTSKNQTSSYWCRRCATAHSMLSSSGLAAPDRPVIPRLHEQRLEHHLRCVSSSALDDDARQPVCLVIGAGAGLGQAVARKFAREGLCVCVVRRGAGQFVWTLPEKNAGADDATAHTAASRVRDDFESFVEDIRSEGGRAEAFIADGSSPDQLAKLIGSVERDVGPIACAVYNVGAQMGARTLQATSYADFQNALSLGAVGAFALAKEVTPFMLRRGRGCLIFTSSTAAFRGNAGQHAHTAAMGARRNLCQSFRLAPIAAVWAQDEISARA